MGLYYKASRMYMTDSGRHRLPNIKGGISGGNSHFTEYCRNSKQAYVYSYTHDTTKIDSRRQQLLLFNETTSGLLPW